MGVYVGETSRSLHERALQHHRNARDFSVKPHIIKHWMNAHGDNNTQPTFNIRIVKKYADCLSRQVGEALKIFYSKDQLLNSKSEYKQNCLARIAVNEANWERKERERREEEEEKLEMRKTNHEETDPKISASADGVPRSRVCAR